MNKLSKGIDVCLIATTGLLSVVNVYKERYGIALFYVVVFVGFVVLYEFKNKKERKEKDV